ncbi:MAG TPA: hypothetical protein VGE26_06385 [Sphingobacteriaceae bacterium]
MSLSRFLILFTGFTLILGAAANLLEQYDPADTILIPKFWVVFATIAFLTLIAFMLSWFGIQKGGEVSVFSILGGIVMKLLFCMVFVLVYLLKFKVNDIQFVLNFFSLYFLFTAFEVYCLLRNLRHQNKT